MKAVPSSSNGLALRRRARRAFALLVVLGVLAAGCGSSDVSEPDATDDPGDATDEPVQEPDAPDDPGDAADEPVQLQPVRALQIPARSTNWIAKELGYYEDEGLEVEWFDAGAEFSSGVMAAIESGQIDTGTFTNYPSLLLARANGAKVVAVLSGYVSAPGVDNFQVGRFYVTEDSPIQSAEDLKGKTVGLWGAVSWAEFILQSYLLKNGVDPSEVETVVVPVPSIVESIFVGQVDAVSMFDALYSQVEERGGARVLFDDTDTDIPWDTLAVGYFFSEDFVEKYPETVAAWVRAEKRAQEFMVQNPEEVVRIIQEVTEQDTSNIPPAAYSLPSCLDEDASIVWATFLSQTFPEVTPEMGPESITNAFNPDC